MKNSKYSEIQNPEKFLPILRNVVDIAKRNGADFVDAIASSGYSLGIGVENSSIKNSESSWDKSLSVRVFINGGMGYVSANGIDVSNLDEIVDHAVELAKIATPDPDFVALPKPEKNVEVKLFDENILSITPEQVIAWAIENIKQAQGVEKNVNISGDAGLSVSSATLVSSTGIELAKKSTSIQIGFFSVVRDGDDVGSFADHSSGVLLKDFHPLGLGETITKRALEYKSQKKTETAKTTLLLGPLSAFGLVRSIVQAAGAESIQRNRSLLAEKLNQQVASNILTVTDNGLIDGGLASSPYDGEGACKKIVKIIDNGKFIAQLHNSYTANKAKTENTGHGMRSGGISPSNLQIERGEKTARQIIEEVDDGIYLEMGTLSPDLVSGDISTNLDFAFKIEKGHLTYPITNAMVGGNLIDMLKNIDAISSDFRNEPGNPMPTIRIRDVQISSGEQ